MISQISTRRGVNRKKYQARGGEKKKGIAKGQPNFSYAIGGISRGGGPGFIQKSGMKKIKGSISDFV